MQPPPPPVKKEVQGKIKTKVVKEISSFPEGEEKQERYKRSLGSCPQLRTQRRILSR